MTDAKRPANHRHLIAIRAKPGLVPLLPGKRTNGQHTQIHLAYVKPGETHRFVREVTLTQWQSALVGLHAAWNSYYCTCSCDENGPLPAPFLLLLWRLLLLRLLLGRLCLRRRPSNRHHHLGWGQDWPSNNIILNNVICFTLDLLPWTPYLVHSHGISMSWDGLPLNLWPTCGVWGQDEPCRLCWHLEGEHALAGDGRDCCPPEIPSSLGSCASWHVTSSRMAAAALVTENLQ